ncbi:hypothetical protein HDE68_001834 [Pedobacter cryoconitis]|uniref:Uncharacterized protein n=1 Tax=Pedobacter cryoconitis TaxID=188932 RepID=A0A7W9DYI0_9SPHI|nr:hypothetical protein [Pedobacter cryoconitis]
MRGANLIKIEQLVIYIFMLSVKNKITAYGCLNVDFKAYSCKMLIISLIYVTFAGVL